MLLIGRRYAGTNVPVKDKCPLCFEKICRATIRETHCFRTNPLRWSTTAATLWAWVDQFLDVYRGFGMKLAAELTLLVVLLDQILAMPQGAERLDRVKALAASPSLRRLAGCIDRPRSRATRASDPQETRQD